MNKKFLKIIATSLFAVTLFACTSNSSSIISSENSELSSSEISSENSQISSSESSSESVDLKAKYNCISIAEALRIATESGSAGSSEKHYVYGIIKEVSNPTYGEMTIYDENGDELYVYGTYSADGVKRYSELEEKPVAGDEIVIYCKLKTYNGSPEADSAWIMEFIHHEVVIDPSQYPESTIKAARTLPDNSLVKVDGVVAKITYANGKIPNGFYLVDDTGSIYVYDSQIASQVKEGNTIEIAAEKVRYISEKELAAANKFGYQGAIQLTNGKLISNDKGNSDFNKSWIKESTVKEIMETPLTNNITSDIFKVNAIVKYAPGDGFDNYYIDDLDGVTGSYVYTQCNGSDFSYLKDLDGEICTVYLSVINAKSANSGVVYRFIPVAVSDDNYVLPESEYPEFALEYAIEDQFESVYNSNPALEVLTSVDYAHLGIENVEISYSSNNTSVASFDRVDSKLFFNVKEVVGSAELTITAKYGDYQATRKLTIEYKEVEKVNTISIAEAIKTEKGTEVAIKGIVTASTINKAEGFYLTDETGIIAVQLSDSSMINSLSIGDEVTVKGTRSYNIYKEEETKQITVREAEIILNNYGNHPHDDSTFKTVTVDEMLALAKDSSTTTAQGYVATGKVIKDAQTYYTNYYFGTAKNNIQFYAANGNQYSMLDNYLDEDVTIEFVFTDWNNKSSYRICLISIITDEGKVINDYNFK